MDGMIRDAFGRPITRRQFLRRSVGVAAGAMLAGCGAPAAAPGTSSATTAPAAPTAASSGEQITLKILNNNWGELYNGLMMKISDEYSKTNTNIKFSWEFTDEWQTKLLTQVAGNIPPDATYTNFNAQASLASKKTFLPLDSYVAEAGLKRDDFVAAMYDASLWDGKLYAIPGGADYICLFWSKDLYKDAGLDPEQPPRTTDELIAHSAKILKKDANGDIARIGYSPGAGDFPRWAYLFGGEFYDATNRKVTANHPANVEALQWMLNYVKLLDINKLTAFNQRPGAYQAGNTFASKQSAYLFDGFWTYDALDKFSPNISYGVTLWPTLKGTADEMKNYMIGGWMYGIPQNTKNPGEAWKFIKYAFIDEAAKMGYLTLNGPCVRKAFDPFLDGLKLQIGAKNRIVPYLDAFTKTGAAGTRYFPVMPVNAFYTDELNRVYDLVVRGQQTPQQGLDEVTKNVQAELDKVKA